MKFLFAKTSPALERDVLFKERKSCNLKIEYESFLSTSPPMRWRGVKRERAQVKKYIRHFVNSLLAAENINENKPRQ